MNAHSEWKKLLYSLVVKYLPQMGEELGLLSNDPLKYKHEDEDEYRGAKMAMQLAGKLFSEDPPHYDTYLFAYGPIPNYKWSTDTRFLITTEKIYFLQEIKKVFGSNIYQRGEMGFRECTPDRLRLSGNKLVFRINSFGGGFSNETVDYDLCPAIYKFLMEANKLAISNTDLYDEAMDELRGEDE